MARAAMYDQFEDVGMAFTEEELKAFKPEEVAEERCRVLVGHARAALRRSEIPDMPKPKWLEEVASRLIDSVTWTLKAMTLEGIDRDKVLSLPAAGSKEGKALTVEAQRWSVEELEGLRSEGEALLRWCVTIGRRCESMGSWRKADRSRSNKLANCLVQDLNRIDRLMDSHGSGVCSAEVAE